uniref:Mce/MlaD domain-containing protein n=1 Tax=Centroceras clavulatum TaxID=159503 RepID=A0A4D6WNF6_9FLOR|nr:hypothetical protein [Centroceras clavulatum]
MEKFFEYIWIIIIFVINDLFRFIAWFKKKHGYSLFVEFSNAYGLKQGTNVNMRGVNIGYVKSLKINSNSVLVGIYIISSNILIPKSSIVETSQTSLFNNTIIDIIPLQKYYLNDQYFIDVFDLDCNSSQFLCHNQYIIGERGLNYDDLIRATTRIAQRFDDPRFFSLFYLFLQNIFEISDDFVDITNTLLKICKTINIYLKSSSLDNL